MKHNLTISHNLCLHEALQKLEVSNIKLLFVLDAKKLVGTITDGDIRRAILNGHQTNETIENFMNKEPFYAYETDTIEYKLSLFDKLPIQYLAIVNSAKELLEIVTKKELGSLPNYAILMAGGLGSRLGELTKHTPKPLLKIGTKPILHTIIEQFRNNDIKKFFISVNYKAEMIKEYFSFGEKWGIDIAYIEETKRLGTAGCLSLINHTFTEPFFVMNGDVLVDINFKEMLNFHLANNFVATMGVVKYTITIPYGVIETDKHNRICNIEEKPNKSYFINAGVYILNPTMIEKIPHNEFYDMPTLFQNLQNEGENIGVYSELKNWLDIGHIDDYQKAQNMFE